MRDQGVAPPCWNSQFQTTKVKQDGWYEEQAWLTSSGRSAERPSTTSGSRAFGRRDQCSVDENLVRSLDAHPSHLPHCGRRRAPLTSCTYHVRAWQARTNGHNTNLITEWGHSPSWEPGFDQHERRTRRSAVPPPPTDAMVDTLRGEALYGPAAEPMVLASGHTMNARPLRSGEPGARSQHAPFATDSDPPDNGGAPPALFDSVTGVVRFTSHSMQRKEATQARQLQIEPGSLTPRWDAGEEPGPRSHLKMPRDNLAGGTLEVMAPEVMAPAAAPPPPPPPLPLPPPGGGAAIINPEIAAAFLQLSTALADRHTSWSAAFQAYDRAGEGVVSMSDLLRVFRAAGLSPSPSLLRSLPPSVLARTGVQYLAIQSMVLPSEPPAYAAPPDARRPPRPTAISCPSKATRPANASTLLHVPATLQAVPTRSPT